MGWVGGGVLFIVYELLSHWILPPYDFIYRVFKENKFVALTPTT